MRAGDTLLPYEFLPLGERGTSVSMHTLQEGGRGGARHIHHNRRH